MQNLINAAIEYQVREDLGMLNIYEIGGRGRILRWVKVMSKKARSIESVVLDGDIGERMVEDI